MEKKSGLLKKMQTQLMGVSGTDVDYGLPIGDV